ncbi:MFS transporter [Comamonas testosteroni]|uniref:Major facilitator superfamily MFS_1 n=1 Tax=Comamonas testosteroni (strain DSM 14576 / KF-1) TaxID=399795 RepID=B7WQQ0_COMTK|nr:MFS transporter [Comamonas testosteroni]EED67045.1 major facilitator superfamily MFS_1 [Comamonas testosteroni KF-1]WQG65251.1 MFS transporter [Comamonas testosteroni]
MSASTSQKSLPWANLLALSMAAFITILTEALPAALLPQMAQDLGVSQAWIGQTVTTYAFGSLVAAIPLVTMTRSMRRRPLLMAAVLGFALANSVTALSDSFTLIMTARIVAGMAAGMLWALLAGYATRLVAPQFRGRAIAVAMAGTPLALSLGVPAGGWLGLAWGWRWCFGLASTLDLLLWLWMWLRLPDFPGQDRNQRKPIAAVMRTPGVLAVLMVVLFYVLAHNILYTYIAPFLAASGVHVRIDLALLVFGIAALPGIWLTGLFVDRHLHRLSMASILLFCGAVLMLGLSWGGSSLALAALAVWGFAFGGSATLFQTSLAQVAGEQVDLAQSLFVTTWNSAIAGGGLAGGLLVVAWGAQVFQPVLLLLLGFAVVCQRLLSGSSIKHLKVMQADYES